MSLTRGLVTGLTRGLTSGLVGTSGSTPFAPSDIPNMLAWYDASDSSTITSSSTFVSQIDDKSGNGQHLQSNNGGTPDVNRPKTGTKSQNGLNVLEFDGNDFMSLDGTTGATVLSGVDANDVTVFMTLNELSSNTAAAAAVCMKTANGGDFYTAKFATMDRTYVFGRTDGVNNFVSPTVVSEDVFNTIVITLGSNGINIWVNGTKTQVTSQAVSGLNWDAFWVARRYNGFLNTMDLGELVFYDGVLPQADIDALSGYGANKWGT